MKKKISPKNRDYYESIVPEIDNLKKNGLINNYIGNKGYSIYKISLNEKIIEFIKKELTVTPFMQSSIVQPNSFPIYLESDKVYVDHFKIDNFGSVSLVRGEDQSYSVALASIIAKVYRDDLMVKYSKIYPKYKFEKNKGYGTMEHRNMIKKYGSCDIHRVSFNLGPKLQRQL